MGRQGVLRIGGIAVAGLVALVAPVPATAQSSDILPETGAMALAGNCSMTIDGSVYERCECRMMVSAAGGQYLLSGLNVGCEGRSAAASALSGQIGNPGRTIQVLYEHGPTTASGSGMWLTSNTATIDNVLTDESWLLLTLRLNGPTRFENSFGKACVDGATGARC